MHLLVKDHKVVKPGELPPTRPVIDDSNSMGTPLSTILSEMTEALADSIKEPAEVSSSEESLHKICKFNTNIDSIPNNEEIICIAFDVIGLYPSLSARETGKIGNQELLNSDVKFEDINYLEISRYIAVTSSVWEIQRTGDRRLVPYRSKTKRTRPGITGKQMTSGESNNHDKFDTWIYPKKIFNTMEKRSFWGLHWRQGSRQATISTVMSLLADYTSNNKVVLQARWYLRARPESE